MASVVGPKSVAFLSDFGDEEAELEDEARTLRIDSEDTDSGEEEEPLFPGLYPVVFFALKQTSPPRIWCLRMVANPWFERVSMLVILINCVTLGLYQPCAHDSVLCESQRCQVLAICDHLVFAFFAIEMLIKIFAMGIWGKLGYLGEAWNRLDFFIVICGILEYTLQVDEMVNFTSVRTVRVLRPLRAINRVPSMRILVMLLLDTLPMLGNVLMLCSFVFFIFGVVAVQLWAGTLRQRCFPEAAIFGTQGANGSGVTYQNSSIGLPLYYGEDFDEGNAQICSLPTFGGDFKCSDPEVMLPSRVDNVTCSLNVTNYVTGMPTDHLYYDPSVEGSLNCIDWNRYYNSCRAGDVNPFMGAISFDNIMYAWVAIFQVISLEGWVDIMYFVMDGYSFYSFIYFILLIVIGSFFMINLCLVVIATQFSETKQREQRLMEEQRLRFKSNDSTLASYSPPGNCYEEMLKYISHLYRKRKRRIMRWWTLRQQEKRREGGCEKHGKRPKDAADIRENNQRKNSKTTKKSKSIHLHHHYHHHHHHYHIADSTAAVGAGNSPGTGVLHAMERGERIVKVGVEIDLHEAPGFDPGASPVSRRLMLGEADTLDIPSVKSSLRLTLPRVTPSFNASLRSLTGSMTSDPRHSLSSDRRKSGDVTITPSGAIYFGPGHADPRTRSLGYDGIYCPRSPKPDSSDRSRSPSFYVRSGSASPSRPRTYVTSDLNCSCSSYDVTHPERVESCAESLVYDEIEERGCCGPCNCKEKWGALKRMRSKASSNVKRVVDSNYFNRGIMIAILVNTLSMGIEHHNQPETLTNVLEISNVVFATLFVLEMISKLMAFGLLGYIKNLYNVFDAVIVIISVWEIVAGTQNGGGLSVLRTFRLLRVLKLVRFLPALRRQLVVLMRTMDNVATFMMLLTLFIFIFSILGMHLFGCEFCKVNEYKETECDRKNFDSLLWAFVTVFQILTQEDWNIVLYNGMASTRPVAAVYFITLMTVGNYVLFNLLVAILVEGFQAECYPERFAQNDDEIDDVISLPLADEYTKKVASNLGLRQPLPTSRSHPKQRRNDAGSHLHHDEDLSESCSGSSATSSDNESEEFDVPIRIGCHANGVSRDDDDDDEDNDVISVTSSCDERGFPAEVPIITRTAATPLPTPTPLASRSSDQGLEADEPSVGLPIRCSLFERNGSLCESIMSIDRRRSSDLSSNGGVGGIGGGLSAESWTASKGSRLSVTSLGKSPRSRSNSFLSRHQKNIPMERRSLVSSQEENEDFPDEDMYSNYSFEQFDEFEARKGSIAEEEYLHQLNATQSEPKLGSSSATLRNESTCDHDHVAEHVLCRCCRTFVSCCAVDKLRRFNQRKEGWSLYVFSPENRFRKFLQKMVSSKWFDYVILIFIFANCVTIAMERPSLKDNAYERFLIDVFNYVFTVVFTLEMTLKVIALGLYIGETAYLKSGWNILDFILVMTSLIDVVMTLSSSGDSKLFGILRVLRLLRALRPLRVISRAPGLKVVVQTLLSSLKPIGNIVLICCAFFIIFGILGVQVFKGRFYYCDGPDIRHVTNMTNCVANPANKWVNHRYNFDDLGQALMSLFVLSSKDGWVEIMYHGIDAVGVDQQPIENYNPWMLIYFISFLLIVGFFVLNMFVGVVVENFHRCREQHEMEELQRREEAKKRKEELLLEKQNRKMIRGKRNFRRKTISRARSHVEGIRGCLKNIKNQITFHCCLRHFKKDDLKYYERYGRTRRAIHSFCLNKYFEVGISLIIGINIITMATEHYNQPEELSLALKYANYAFTTVFVLEALLKLVALGICRYFRDKWNQLDMLIVILSIIGIIIEDMSSGGDRSLFINPTIIRVMRVLRIARVLKLLKISKGIRSLLETVACALPQVGNLGMLFVLLFFIFAALGVELFGTLTCDVNHPCDGLNRHASFHNFGIALLTLFRISTGDNWNGIMKDTLRETCDASAECSVNCCVSTVISPIYFVLFVMMAQFVLVNVVVAVLMKQLEDNRAESSEGDVDDDVFDDEEEEEEEEEEEKEECGDHNDLDNNNESDDDVSLHSSRFYDEADERSSLLESRRDSVISEHEKQLIVNDDLEKHFDEPTSRKPSVASTARSTPGIGAFPRQELSTENLYKEISSNPSLNIIPAKADLLQAEKPTGKISKSLNDIMTQASKCALPVARNRPLSTSKSWQGVGEAPQGSPRDFPGPLKPPNINHNKRRMSDYCTTCECCEHQHDVAPGVSHLKGATPPSAQANGEAPRHQQQPLPPMQHLLSLPTACGANEPRNKSYPQLPCSAKDAEVATDGQIHRTRSVPAAGDSLSPPGGEWTCFEDDRPD